MNSFVKKLYFQEKISKTETSKQIALAYITKSEKSLVSAKKLLEMQNYDDALALTYYSMYYCSIALLHRCGIKSKNHLATMLLLKELFSINTERIEKAKKDRIDKQYYVDSKTTAEEVKKGIEIAEDFNAELIEKIELIAENEITKYRFLLDRLVSN